MSIEQKVYNDLVKSTCPCCGSSQISKFTNDLHILKPIYYSTILIDLQRKSYLSKCNSCDSIFKQNAIHEKNAIELYKNGESGSRWHTNETFEEEKTETVVNAVKNYLPHTAKVMDIGCSTGRLLDFIKSTDLSCKTYGIEYSKEARDICIQKGHQMVDDLKGFDHSLDIIYIFDVVEHMYDLPSFIASSQKALTKNGLLIILTGNPYSLPARMLKKNWWYYSFPEHVIFPSLKYYQNLQEFSLVEYKKVFNAKSYKKGTPLKLFFKFIYYFKLHKKYTGLPSFVTDHHLIILRNNEQ